MGETRLRFYTDTHIAKVISTQLQIKGVDILRCEDVNMATVKDDEHLEYATAHNRIMITHDQDFLRLDADWRTQGKSHSGIFFIQQYLQGNVGEIVKQLMEYVELVEVGAAAIETDIASQVTYIG